MCEQEQKNEERFYLQKFIEVMGWTPDRIEAHERPDFILTLKGHRVGLEVTMFHKDHNRRAAEEGWARLLEELMTKVRNHPELLLVYGRLEFSSLQIPRGKDRTSFVGEVVNLSLTHCPQEGKKSVNLQDFGGQYPLAVRYLKTLMLKRARVAMTWGSNLDIGFAASSEDQFMPLTRDKLGKASAYNNTNLQALWLLVISGPLVSQAARRFGAAELNDWRRLNNMLSDSPFDRIFFFQYMHDRVLEFDRSRGYWTLAEKGQP